MEAYEHGEGKSEGKYELFRKAIYGGGTYTILENNKVMTNGNGAPVGYSNISDAIIDAHHLRIKEGNENTSFDVVAFCQMKPENWWAKEECCERKRKFGINQKTIGEFIKEQDGLIASKKNDRLDNKVRMELLPMDALEAIAKIYTFGAEKYGVGTWRQLPDGSERYRAALLRHMTAECKGEELDPESGLPHVFHEAWNALARVAIYLDEHKEEHQYIRCGKGLYDRLKESE